MCGFGMDLIFRVAIFLVVVLVIVAMIQWAAAGWVANLMGSRFWGLIQIVIGGVIAILILLFIWRLAECAGLIRGAMNGNDIVAISGVTIEQECSISSDRNMVRITNCNLERTKQ